MPSAVRTRDSDPFRSSDPYAGDNFRMYEFKVRRCVRGRTHDWTDCPFAHPGEKACRRDPRRFHYSGNACPDFRRGACRRGDACELAHGVFESWLHPARYRTQTCRDGRSCRRKVCFFAHTPSQLRVLPSPTSPPTGSSSSSPASGKQRILICSCAFCPCKSPVSSPNSTLNMGLSHFSPPLSPPLSPVYSPSLDCNSAYRNVFNYKSLLTELVNSLETMDLSSVVSPSASSTATVDAFLLSPASSVSRDYSTNYQEKDDINAEESSFSNNINGCPDLDWVNELVM